MRQAEFERLMRERKPSGRFRVMTVAEFLNSGPPLHSREHKLAVQAEERAKDKREAAAQRRRDAYQARRERMTPLEQAYDDLEMLCEMPVSDNIREAVNKQNQLINQLERLERLFDKYEKDNKNYG